MAALGGGPCAQRTSPCRCARARLGPFHAGVVPLEDLLDGHLDLVLERAQLPPGLLSSSHPLLPRQPLLLCEGGLVVHLLVIALPLVVCVPGLVPEHLVQLPGRRLVRVAQAVRLLVPEHHPPLGPWLAVGHGLAPGRGHEGPHALGEHLGAPLRLRHQPVQPPVQPALLDLLHLVLLLVDHHPLHLAPPGHHHLGEVRGLPPDRQLLLLLPFDPPGLHVQLGALHQPGELAALGLFPLALLLELLGQPHHLVHQVVPVSLRPLWLRKRRERLGGEGRPRLWAELALQALPNRPRRVQDLLLPFQPSAPLQGLIPPPEAVIRRRCRRGRDGGIGADHCFGSGRRAHVPPPVPPARPRDRRLAPKAGGSPACSEGRIPNFSCGKIAKKRPDFCARPRCRKRTDPAVSKSPCQANQGPLGQGC